MAILRETGIIFIRKTAQGKTEKATADKPERQTEYVMRHRYMTLAE